MFRLVMRGTQEDRFKQDSDTKSCLTLVLSGSDNHSIRFCGRRKSFCGLQLDGFFGAMLWSHGAIVARVDGLWPVDESPRVADQTGLPIISGLCGQPCFWIQKHRSCRRNFAQSVCCGNLSSIVFTYSDWNSGSNGRSSASLCACSKLCPKGLPNRDSGFFFMSAGSIA
jgi:hypothetical protein